MPMLGRRSRVRLSSPLNTTAGKRRSKSLTASGERVRRQDMANQRRLLQPWQSTSFDFYDKLGEIKQGSKFYSRMLAPLELYAAEFIDNEWVPTDDKDAIDALDRIQDPGGGRDSLQWDYGRLMFLIGEAELFVSRDDYGDEQWEMLSPDELRIQDGYYYRYRAPSLGAEEYLPSGDEANEKDEDLWVPAGRVDTKGAGMKKETAVAYRIWQRHPRWSGLADSTMRGVLDICEELDLLTKGVRARTRSRLAGNGVLFIDEDISPAPPEAAPDEDPVEDAWLNDLIDAMMSPLEDEGSAAAMVPLIARVKSKGDNQSIADLVHHLQLVDPTQLYPETGLRYECIKRLAVGLDMPPEELTGMTDANHWTAWIVDENTWKAHGQQKADQLVNDLTSAYFRPFLRDVLGYGDKARKFAIKYDPSAVINHPDRSKDAKDLHDRFAIGDEALRDACGFDEDDAPTTEEMNRMIGIAIRDGSLALFGIPTVRGAIEPDPGEIQEGDTSEEGAEKPAEAEKGTPSKNGNGKQSEETVAPVVARIQGAADLALLRAREAAGSRLVSLANKNAKLRSELRGVRKCDVAAVLGRERVRALKAPDERELVSGARDLIADALRLYGLDDPEIATVMCDTIERHAARTLYDRDSTKLPDTFALYVTGLVVQARLPVVDGSNGTTRARPTGVVR